MDPNGSFFLTEGFVESDGILEEEFPSQSDNVLEDEWSGNFNFGKEKINSLDEFEDLERVVEFDKKWGKREEDFNENGVIYEGNTNNSNSGSDQSGDSFHKPKQGDISEKTNHAKDNYIQDVEEGMEDEEDLSNYSDSPSRPPDENQDPSSDFILIRYMEETPRMTNDNPDDRVSTLSVNSRESRDFSSVHDDEVSNEDYLQGGVDSDDDYAEEVVRQLVEDEDDGGLDSEGDEGSKESFIYGRSVDPGGGSCHSSDHFAMNDDRGDYQRSCQSELEDEGQRSLTYEQPLPETTEEHFSDEQWDDLGDTVIPTATYTSVKTASTHGENVNIDSERKDSNASLDHFKPTAVSTKRSVQRRDSNVKTKEFLSPARPKNHPPDTSLITPGRIPRLNLQKKSAGSVSDISLPSHQTSEELTNRLLDEKKTRRQADEMVHQLQFDYDELLEKYAQAENTIDQMRLGAKVNLYSDGPKGGQSSSGQVTHLKQAQIIQLSGPQRASVTIMDPYSSDRRNSVHSLPHQTRGEVGGQSDGVDGFADQRQREKEMRGKAADLKEQIDFFVKAIADGHIQPNQQRDLFDRLKQDLTQLEGDYLQAKEDHKERQRRSVFKDDEVTFDPERSLDGQIFQIGMKMEDVQERVEENLRSQPVQESTPSVSHRQPQVDVTIPANQHSVQAESVNLNDPEAVLLEKYKALKQLPATPSRDKEIEKLVQELHKLQTIDENESLPKGPSVGSRSSAKPEPIGKEHYGDQQFERDSGCGTPISNSSLNVKKSLKASEKRATRVDRPALRLGPRNGNTDSNSHSSQQKSPELEFDSGFMGSESSRHSQIKRGGSLPREWHHNGTISGGFNDSSSQGTVIQTKMGSAHRQTPIEELSEQGLNSSQHGERQRRYARRKQKQPEPSQQVTDENESNFQEESFHPAFRDSPGARRSSKSASHSREVAQRSSGVQRPSRLTRPIQVMSQNNLLPQTGKNTMPSGKGVNDREKRRDVKTASSLKRYQGVNPRGSDVVSSASKSVKSEQLEALQDEIDHLRQELRKKDAEVSHRQIPSQRNMRNFEKGNNDKKSGLQDREESVTLRNNNTSVYNDDMITVGRKSLPLSAKKIVRNPSTSQSSHSLPRSQAKPKFVLPNPVSTDYADGRDWSRTVAYSLSEDDYMGAGSPDRYDVNSVQSTQSSKSEILQRLKEELNSLKEELRTKKEEDHFSAPTVGNSARSFALPPPSNTSTPNNRLHHNGTFYTSLPSRTHLAVNHSPAVDEREKFKESLRRQHIPRSSSVDERINWTRSLPGFKTVAGIGQSFVDHLRSSPEISIPLHSKSYGLPAREVSFHPSASFTHENTYFDSPLQKGNLNPSQPCLSCNGSGLHSSTQVAPELQSNNYPSTSFPPYRNINQNLAQSPSIPQPVQSVPVVPLVPQTTPSTFFHQLPISTNVPHAANIPNVTSIPVSHGVLYTPQYTPASGNSGNAMFSTVPPGSFLGSQVAQPSFVNTPFQQNVGQIAPQLNTDTPVRPTTSSNSPTYGGARPVYLVPSSKGRYYFRDPVSDMSSDVEEIIYRRRTPYHSTPKAAYHSTPKAPYHSTPMVKSKRFYNQSKEDFEDDGLDDSLKVAIRVAQKLNRSTSHMLSNIRQDLRVAEIMD